MEPKHKFVQLCDEILVRIDEEDGEAWWEDVTALSWQLEESRRELVESGLITARDSEWPAFLIVDAYRDIEITTLPVHLNADFRRH